MTPREATIQAMNEVTGPVIAITLVLMAVFLPTAFLGGITGQLYRQFALTIAATALISAVNALTLKPAQCAMWLRPVEAEERVHPGVRRGVQAGRERRTPGASGGCCAVWWLVLLGVRRRSRSAPGGGTRQTPTGFLPDEDQGYVIIAVQLPDAASLDRTREVTDRMNTHPAEHRGGRELVRARRVLAARRHRTRRTARPRSPRGRTGRQRTTPELPQEALVKRAAGGVRAVPEAHIFVLVPPSIQGLGFAGGFQMQIEDREGVGLGRAAGADARDHRRPPGSGRRSPRRCAARSAPACRRST